ncbi:MAG: hypothetical protein KJZ64_04400 [Sphingomonadaceae bacterium]|nr:hypothetical protein [Sphingomonadaceae bacterium]
MFAFTRSPARRKGAGAALAFALMCGSALGMFALEAPAAAQKNKKEEKAGKTNYSKGFIAAYKVAEDLSKAGKNDEAKAQLPTVVSAIETDDDRNAGGGLVFNIGVGLSDTALQLQGLELMLASGKTDPAKVGSFNYTGYQLAMQEGQYDAARKFLGKAIEVGHTFTGRYSDGTERQSGPDDMHAMYAETYFDQNDYATGLAYMTRLIDERAASGGAIPQIWITRPLGVAYNNDQAGAAIEFAKLFAKHFPSDTSWGDAIAIQRNLVDYDPQQTLDILRLAARTNALRDTRSYVDYIDAADARRLPGEVKRVIDAGIAAGKLTSGDVYVSEASGIANARIAADKADLPALERDAKAANATGVTASAAGDAFLSYEDYARAEAMYMIAATKPGVDMERVLLRLGIAQVGQGKTAEALATLAKVSGARKNIADLWAIYAQQKAGPAS